jgi:hypothetical protein
MNLTCLRFEQAAQEMIIWGPQCGNPTEEVVYGSNSSVHAGAKKYCEILTLGARQWITIAFSSVERDISRKATPRHGVRIAVAPRFAPRLEVSARGCQD